MKLRLFSIEFIAAFRGKLVFIVKHITDADRYPTQQKTGH